MFIRITKGNKLLTKYDKFFSFQWNSFDISIVNSEGKHFSIHGLELKSISENLYVEKKDLVPAIKFDIIIDSFVTEKLKHLYDVVHCLVIPEKQGFKGNYCVLKIHLLWIDDNKVDKTEVNKIKEIMKQLFNDFIVYELYEDFGEIKTKDIGGSNMLAFETLVEVSKTLIEEIKNQKDKFDLNCIRIYPSDKAPEFLKKLCPDDADWYVLVPDNIYDNYYIGFLESSSFGTMTHVFPIAGFRVVVGCHA